jgi:hypothetical protein
MSSILIDWLTNLTKTFSSNKKKFLNIIKKVNNQKKGIDRSNRFQVNYIGKKPLRGSSMEGTRGKKLLLNLIKRNFK